MTERLPPDVIAQLTGMDPAITPELVATSWAVLKPFHDKAGYTAPKVDRDLAYGDHERHRLDVHTAGDESSTSGHGVPVLVFVHGGDPARIVLAGHSAGAVHVASYLAGQGGGTSDGVKGAGLLSGFYQIPDGAERGELEVIYFGDRPSAGPLI